MGMDSVSSAGGTESKTFSHFDSENTSGDAAITGEDAANNLVFSSDLSI